MPLPRFLTRLKKTLRQRKFDIILILAWSFLLSAVVIKIHWITYTQTKRLSYYRIPYTVYEGPTPTVIDLFIVAISGLIVGLFISDIKSMFFGYIATILLCFAISVTYVTLYIWFVQGWGVVFGANPYDWEWAVYLATLNVFPIIFPLFACVALITLAIGAFLQTYVR